MPRRVRSLPPYRRHKPSGQAVVTLNGRDHYLGVYGSETSRILYDRTVAEWLANDRRPAQPSADEAHPAPTVNELILAYWKHVEVYYVKAGKPTSEQSNIRQALRWLRRLYGTTLASEFGPLALKAVRQTMIDAGRARTTINKDIARIRQVFRWGVANELVPAEVDNGLRAVQGLKRGRCSVRETQPVRPVPDDLVDAIRDHVARPVWAMVELQRLTGMRSGEIVIMRGCDIEMDAKVWIYRPACHKTEHHGHERVVELGPKAQAVIAPFLSGDARAFLFRPGEAAAERRELRHRRRRTPLHRGNSPGTNRTTNPRRKPTDRYSCGSYRRAIDRGLRRAFPHAVLSAFPQNKLNDEQREELARWNRDHHWHPHQLRHSFGTRVRRLYGLEMARILLGQHTLQAAAIYSEVDRQRASTVASEIG